MGGTEGEIEESYLSRNVPKKTLLFSLPLSGDNLIMSYKNVRQKYRHTGTTVYLLGCRQTLTIGKRKNPSARWDSLSLGRGRKNRKAREKKQKEGGKRSEEEEEEEEEDRIYDSFLCVLTRSHTRRPSALASHPPPPL